MSLEESHGVVNAKSLTYKQNKHGFKSSYRHGDPPVPCNELLKFSKKFLLRECPLFLLRLTSRSLFPCS